MIFDGDSWQEIWSVVRRNRLRTFLTALGVFWGIFMLIVMVGAGNGLERGVKRTMTGHATNAVFVWGNKTSVPYKGLSPGREVHFDNGDVAALRAVPGVEYLAPRNQLGGWRGDDYDLNALFPRGQVQSPKVRAFVDFLVERLNFDESYMQVFCEDTERCQHLMGAAAAAEAAAAELHRVRPEKPAVAETAAVASQ